MQYFSTAKKGDETMARAITAVDYREEASMIAILDAMNEPLDPKSAALLAQFREDVARYEADHPIASPAIQSEQQLH